MNSMLTSCLLWVSVVSFNHYCYCYEYKMSRFSSFDITLTIQVYCICWLFSITIGKVWLCYLRRIKGFVYILHNVSVTSSVGSKMLQWLLLITLWQNGPVFYTGGQLASLFCMSQGPKLLPLDSLLSHNS